MSFDLNLSASVERELERYAQAERVTKAQAAEKLIRFGLKASKRKATKNEITDAEWRQLREIPEVAFLEKLPDSSIDSIEAASKQIRAERITPRG